MGVLRDGAVGSTDVHDRGDRAIGPTVLLANDHFLRDVHQPAGQVAGVGRPQRRIRESLPGAVRRDEVLQDGQTLAEVGLDRPGDDLALRVGNQTTHPGELPDLHDVPTGTRVGHHVDGVRRGELSLHGLLDLVRRLRPDLDQLLATLIVGDDAAAVLLLHLLGALLVIVQDGGLRWRRRDVLDPDRHASPGRVVEPEVLQVVEDLLHLRAIVSMHDLIHQTGDVALQHRLVAELEVIGERGVEHGAPDRGPHDGRTTLPLLGGRVVAFRQHLGWERLAGDADTNRVVQGVPPIEREERLRHRPERRGVFVLAVLVLSEREVIETEHHVLGRGGDRTAVCRGQDIVGRQHQDPGFGLRLGGQRQVHRHLVPIEVRVERRAHERVDLDGLALHEHGLERLDPEPVQRGCPVQQDRVLADDLFEHVPHLWASALHHPLGALDVLSQGLIDQPLHHERLEELERHLLGQTALVQPELRTDDDDRTPRVVDSLAEQVLAETTLLPLQHV